MSEQDVNTMRTAYEAFNRGDVPAVLEAFDPQIEWYEPGGGLAPHGTFSGAESVANDVFATVPENFDEFEAQPDAFIDAGEHLVVLVPSAASPRPAARCGPATPMSGGCGTARRSAFRTMSRRPPGPRAGAPAERPSGVYRARRHARRVLQPAQRVGPIPDLAHVIGREWTVVADQGVPCAGRHRITMSSAVLRRQSSRIGDQVQGPPPVWSATSACGGEQRRGQRVVACARGQREVAAAVRIAAGDRWTVGFAVAVSLPGSRPVVPPLPPLLP
jgi:ketosteroid isomerase-like protein